MKAILVLCILVVSIRASAVLKELQETSLRGTHFEHTPTCFNTENTFQLRQGKLLQLEKSPYNWNIDENSVVVKELSATELYPDAGDSLIDSLYVTESSHVAVGISKADVVCVLNDQLQLLDCVTGPTASEFGKSVYLDEQLGLLLIGAPASSSFFISYLHDGSWQPASAVHVQNAVGTDDDDELGNSVSCAGNICAVGAPFANAGSGAIYMFSYDAEHNKLKQFGSLNNIKGMYQLGKLVRVTALAEVGSVILQSIVEMPGAIISSVHYISTDTEKDCSNSAMNVDGLLKHSQVVVVENTNTICVLNI